MKPHCHNRPAFDTPMSPDVCQVWAENDHRIMDPAHPKFGMNAGDYYPRAMGFADWCNTCIWRPA